MEKRNNKKLFAIIGGSVLAFVLTIALSVSITLAYFGSTTTSKHTVTMDAAVNVSQQTTTKGTLTGALPGEAVQFDGTATVTSGTNGAYLAAKVEITDSKNLLTDEQKSNYTLGDGWTKGTGTAEGYWFYATSETALTKLAATTDTAELEIRFVLPVSLNDDAGTSVAGQSLEVKVTYIAVQGKVFYTSTNAPDDKAEGDENTAPGILDIIDMVKDVENDLANA